MSEFDLEIFLLIVSMRFVKQVLISTASKLERISIFILFVSFANLFALNDSIDRFDKSVDRDRASALSRVKEFSDLDNFFFGENIRVFSEKILEFIRINTSIYI